MLYQKLSVLGLLYVAVVLGFAAVHAIHICDMCKCTRIQGEVKSVSCDCNSETKDLNITRDKMTNVMHITSFAVSNCSSLTFQQNSFASSHDLQSVSVSRVRLVKFNVGVFSSLSTLLVEDVSNLQLAKMGLLGAGDIQDITIHRSNISVLPAFAIYDVKGLKKVEFKDVVIGLMKKQSIKLTMADSSSFVIENCQVDTIEKGAVELQTSKLLLNHSHFQEIANQAVNVSASESVKIMLNVFGAGCSNKGILVKSNRIEIENNTFNILPIGLLSKQQEFSQIITFTNNIVYSFTLTSDGGVDLTTMLRLDNFRDNKVLCNCNVTKSVIAYMAFQTASSTRDTVKENYCFSDSESNCELSLEALANEKERVCGDEDTEATDIDTICQNLPEQHPTALVTPESGRGGRAEGVTEKSADASKSTTTTTHEHDAHEAEPHHASAADSEGTVNSILIGLIMITTSTTLCLF